MFGRVHAAALGRAAVAGRQAEIHEKWDFTGLRMEKQLFWISNLIWYGKQAKKEMEGV